MSSEPSLTLYDFDNSVCCQKVRIVLVTKTLKWDSVRIDLFRNEQYAPAYLAINPAAVVPALDFDGEVVTESTLICEYLDEKFPLPPLVPSDPLARTRMRRWSKMVDEGLHEGVGMISFSAMFRERLKNMTDEQRAIRFLNVGDPRRRDVFTSTYELGARSPFVEHGIFAYEKAFKHLEETLAEGGPWILGEAVSLADIALMPYVARLNYLKVLELWIADRPRVQAWWRRVQAWPKFKAGLVDRLSRAEIDEMAEHGPKVAEDIAATLEELRATQIKLKAVA